MFERSSFKAASNCCCASVKFPSLNCSIPISEKFLLLNQKTQFLQVSAETAEAMAVGMREKTATDYAISVTGIAGPTGGTEEKPVGTIFIGYSSESETRSLHLKLPGDRNLIRWRASQAALDYLRRKLI